MATYHSLSITVSFSHAKAILYPDVSITELSKINSSHQNLDSNTVTAGILITLLYRHMPALTIPKG